jgi:N-acetyl-gamma-glutamylphosphate reductase
LAHPRVEFEGEAFGPGLRFRQGEWRREILVGEAAGDVAGVVELLDNNPIVCATSASVPGPEATAVLLALGPARRSGIGGGAEVSCSSRWTEGELESFMARMELGPAPEVICVPESSDRMVVASAVLLGAEDFAEVAELYDEAYLRSFFVGRSAESEGRSPRAVYAVRAQQGAVAVEVRLDRDGKGGAAQVAHLMNVMAGFEETLGLERFPQVIR